MDQNKDIEIKLDEKDMEKVNGGKGEEDGNKCNNGTTLPGISVRKSRQ